MIHEVQFTIDTDQLPNQSDEHLASLWHIAQANPSPDETRDAGDLAERIGREIISRFIKSTAVPLWERQGTDFFHAELRRARAAVAAAAAIPPAPAGIAPNSFANPANWVTVPRTLLADGTVVEAFQMSRYPVARDDSGSLVLTDSLPPLVNVTYHEAVKLCAGAGVRLSRETEELAVRTNAAGHAANWTGGTAGEGSVYQGVHLGRVSRPQSPTYQSEGGLERQYHTLSNGESIFGLAGNVYTWVHDDVQGDDQGLVKSGLAADSISLTSAPYPSMKKGMGYRPDGARDWSGIALVRGGFWNGGDDAGVFALDYAYPGGASDRVGFRCTKPISGR